jgi:two-component system response regulator AlgR
MTPARILIVDDEQPARRRLRDLLDDCRDAFPLVIADEAANGVEAIDIINRGEIDIVLCDIRMPVMDGIEVAGHIAKLEHKPKLIFTTAYDAYAVQAFELNAIDYLLKPIKQARLQAALARAAVVKPAQAEAVATATQTARKHLSIHERGKIVLVPIEDILYLKAELKYITVKTEKREYLLEESLTKLEEEFSRTFARVHRSVLVARKAVIGFEKAGESDEEGGSHWVVLLAGTDEKLPVSRRQQHVIKEF